MAERNYPIIIAIIGGIFTVIAAFAPYIIKIIDNSEKVPELSIDTFTISPMPPIQGRPVRVVATIRNSGDGHAQNVLVQWWPGVNFPDPVSQNISSLQPDSTKQIEFNYDGYASWYGRLETKMIVNPNNLIIEGNGSNNEIHKTISVVKNNS
jgi:hypothetical protein